MEPSQARHLLQRHADTHSDELCATMMRTLDRLTALRSSVDAATLAAVEAALALFVSACRKVATQDRAAVDVVGDELDALQRLCDKQGEFYEYFDANGTAITYWQAATYVQHARVTLT